MVTLSRLRFLRQRRALTQQQLAEKAGVNRVTVARLETGADSPKPTTVRKLADALRVGPEDLMDPSPLGGAEPALGNGGSSGAKAAADNLLRREPGLAALVEQAQVEVMKTIPDARFTLQLLVDPDDTEDDEGQLALGILTDLPDEEGLAALARFDAAWWLDNVARANGRLCIDILFR
jgi:transcriptional regulator with XRE-family HTH domain